MSRVQVQDQGDVTLRPGAAPVNRFSTPEQPLQEVGPTKAMQLSNALGDLVPELLKFSANKDQRNSQQDILNARATRAKNAVTFKDAVNSGQISADQNPWFVKTWKEMDGSVAADRYNEDLLLAMSTGPLANSTDHSDSTKLLDNFRQNWVKDNIQNEDGDFTAGFQAKAAGYDLNIRAHQAAVVGNNIVAAAGDAFDHNIQGIISESDTRGISADAVAEGINREADKFLLAGGSKQDVNKMIIKAAITAGFDNLDVSHAEAILGAVNGGPGGKLGGTTAAKEALQSLTTKVADELHQRDSWAYEADTRADKEVITNANMTVGTQLLELALKHQPATLEQFKTQIDAVYKVGGWEQAQNLQKAILASQKENMTEAIMQKEALVMDIYTKHMTNFDRLNRALSAGEINVATYQTLGTKMNEIIEAEKRENKEPSFWKNQAYIRKSDFLTKFLLGDEKIFNGTAIASSNQAGTQFWDRMYEWDKANPKATPQQQSDEATKVSQQLMEDFRFGDMKSLVGPIENVINNAPGVKAGRVTPVGASLNLGGGGKTPDKLPGPDEPAFPSSDEFHRALSEAELNPQTSRLQIMATQHGMTLAEFIAIQAAQFPEDTPAKGSKK